MNKSTVNEFDNNFGMVIGTEVSKYTYATPDGLKVVQISDPELCNTGDVWGVYWAAEAVDDDGNYYWLHWNCLQDYVNHNEDDHSYLEKMGLECTDAEHPEIHPEGEWVYDASINPEVHEINS